MSPFRSPLVRRLLPFIALVMSARNVHAQLNARDSKILSLLYERCQARRTTNEQWIKSHPAPALQASKAQALSTLAQPIALSPDFWKIKTHGTQMKITDAASARAYAMVNGRVSQVEFACSGASDAELWRALATSTTPSNEILSAWKKSLLALTSHAVSFPQISVQSELADFFVHQRLLVANSSALKELKSRTALKVLPPLNTRSGIPSLNDPKDPRWVAYAKTVQARELKEQQIANSAAHSLAALSK